MIAFHSVQFCVAYRYACCSTTYCRSTSGTPGTEQSGARPRKCQRFPACQMMMMTKISSWQTAGWCKASHRNTQHSTTIPFGVWVCVSFRRRQAEMAFNGLAMLCGIHQQQVYTGARWQSSRPPRLPLIHNPSKPHHQPTYHKSMHHRLDKFYIDNKISTYNHRANFCHSRQPACNDLRTNNM